MTGYTEKILKYAADDTYVGLLATPDGTGEVGLSGQEAGKRLAVRFTLKVQKERIEDIRFQVFGCGFTIAACAAAAELSDGHPLSEIEKYTPETIDRVLGGLPADRSYCAALAHQALQAALASARNGAAAIQTELSTTTDEDHGARISPNDPLFQQLMSTPKPTMVTENDRRMFAGLLTAASQEPCSLGDTLGVDNETLVTICTTYFPGYDPIALIRKSPDTETPAQEINEDVLNILLSHVPCESTGKRNQTSEWLAQIIAARAAQPGHLWVSMGFLKRPELTAAIDRHLPTLAAANNQKMRWKRYLFKQVCDMNGGTLCKSPNCNECSDYPLCFPPEEQ